MPLASWAITTHNRPQLLEVVLESLYANVVPKGWDVEFVIACTRTDPALKLELPGEQHWISLAPYADITAKVCTAIHATEGDLVLRASDDDLQSPRRLTEAVDAYHAGAVATGCSAFWFCDLAETERLAWWDGPADKAGGMHNYNGAWIREHLPDQLEPVRSGADAVIREALPDHEVTPLIDVVGRTTVCLQHGGNTSARPFPLKDHTVEHGNFVVTGGGPWMGVGFERGFRKLIERARGCVR